MCLFLKTGSSGQGQQGFSVELRDCFNVKPDFFFFFYSVETSDGKTHQEEGQLKDVGTENESLVVRGSFSYVGDDGQTYTVNYLADENGFQPEGEHLPRL